ncbi:MAG: hypothetical protein IH616_09755 [Gemmatimonadales bacterium]|nr:hypothetical protein [Gemmatimonadales bacterium]
MSGDVLLDNGEKNRLQSTMWPDGILAASVTARSAPRIAELARMRRAAMANTHLLMVDETGAGSDFPFSGEKLSPALTVYGARDFDHACKIIDQIYAPQGAGHSKSAHSSDDRNILLFGFELPVLPRHRVSGALLRDGRCFDNDLPFSLSMG